MEGYHKRIKIMHKIPEDIKWLSVGETEGGLPKRMTNEQVRRLFKGDFRMNYHLNTVGIPFLTRRQDKLSMWYHDKLFNL